MENENEANIESLRGRVENLERLVEEERKAKQQWEQKAQEYFDLITEKNKVLDGLHATITEAVKVKE